MSDNIPFDTVNVGTPRCFVEIYPFEGGKFTVAGSSLSLLHISVAKSIRDANPGSFVMQLAPGGPFGPNSSPQWLTILTPMSLVAIGMRRYGYQQIVMVGVITDASESETWDTGQKVQRTVRVSGVDFQYFFAQENYYVLTLLQGSFLAVLNQPESLSAIDQGLLQGPPDIMAEAWYRQIMAGPASIMGQTQFPYEGNTLKLFDLIRTHFSPYDYSDLSIPAGDNFMIGDGSWISKFFQFFPFPWYEFFIITAPTDAYPGLATQQTGAPLRMLSMPQAKPVSPTLVARPNPLPWSEATNSSATSPAFKMNSDTWNKLDVYMADSPPMQKSLLFSDGETKNYYVIMPIFASSLIGSGNGQQAPFAYLFSTWVDIASIHRYGYRPQITDVHWFTDSSGAASKQNAANGDLSSVNLLVRALALRQTSFFEPTPLMARASVTINLRPDIMPGSRFLYSPFKDQQPWEFYIEAVSHDYTFGASAVTTLQLSRGLPAPVYSDPALLLAIHTGTAQRKEGVYVSGVPAGLGKGLVPLNQSTINQGLLGEIAQVFTKVGAQ